MVVPLLSIIMLCIFITQAFRIFEEHVEKWRAAEGILSRPESHVTRLRYAEP